MKNRYEIGDLLKYDDFDWYLRVDDYEYINNEYVYTMYIKKKNKDWKLYDLKMKESTIPMVCHRL